MTRAKPQSQLSYAIAFSGQHAPDWARTCIQELNNIHGDIDVTWIRLKEDRATLQPESVQRVRLSGSDLKFIELVDDRPCASERVFATISSLNLDFILFLDSHELTAEWSGLAKQGVWYFQFGNCRNPETFGVQEVMGRRLTQAVQLQRFGAQTTSTTTLKIGYFKSCLSSLARHRRAVLSQCSEWPGLLAQELLDSGRIADMVMCRTHPKRSSLFRLPETLVQYLNIFKTLAQGFLRIYRYQRWNIGVVKTPLAEILIADKPLTVEWLLKPKWPYCYADPFPFEYNGQKYVVAEEFNFLTDHGTIVVFSLDKNGEASSSPTTALDFPFHISYPCMVNEGEHLYCLAETLETREITIYRCEKFPFLWTKVAMVAAGRRFADPTLFKHEGRWWVFSTLFDEVSGGNASLFAWYADNIAGPWSPHLKNPIKCDVSSSRSAGNPFRIGPNLFRPAQDCSRQYGQNVVLNRICDLSPSTFHEDSERVIPRHSRYRDGFHHLASFGDMVLVDGRQDRFHFAAARLKLGRLVSRLRDQHSLGSRSKDPLANNSTAWRNPDSKSRSLRLLQ